ncbi:hypothetical protein AC579_3012 [Pseudocercospora musae]|uniref:Uncharacterized protein n=1 Tax=Pseudocercospora musae TaxID=113226 RepID=A0A139I4M8_9PEZI|nr:hypothetical protein AC579_3012 [Pseudocercospora musae]KXT09657.1 hypothetical protein AC579_3012 [Pseudocercospora musae]
MQTNSERGTFLSEPASAGALWYFLPPRAVLRDHNGLFFYCELEPLHCRLEVPKEQRSACTRPAPTLQDPEDSPRHTKESGYNSRSISPILSSQDPPPPPTQRHPETSESTGRLLATTAEPSHA